MGVVIASELNQSVQKLGDCPQIVVKRLIRISRRDPGCFGEINAKTQRCKDAKEDPGCFGSGFQWLLHRRHSLDSQKLGDCPLQKLGDSPRVR
jgi:hypothetical protein